MNRGMFWLGLTLGVLLAAGASAIHDAHRRQWPARCLRQIRALPEQPPIDRQETP